MHLQEILKLEGKTQNRNIYPVNDLAQLTYIELLEQKEWKELRQVIFKRDSYSCRNCGNKEVYKKWYNEEKKWRYFKVSIPDTCRKHLNYYTINGITDSFYIFDDRYITLVETEQPRSLHLHHTYYLEKRLP